MTTSVHFYLRRSLRGNDYLGSLYARITRGRRSVKVTLPLQLYASEWDSLRQKVVFATNREWRFEKLRWIASELERVERLFRSVIDRLEMSGRNFTARDVVSGYRRSQGGFPLAKLVADLREELLKEERVRTAEAYMSTYRKLTVFFRTNEKTDGMGKVKEPELRHLTSAFIKNFEQSLWKEDLMANTVSFYMRNLRAIYNKGVEQGLLECPVTNPFAGVYTGIPVTVKRALSKKEIRQMVEKIHPSLPDCRKVSYLSADRGTRAALLFLFSFYARGMSFIDVAYLRKENIKGEVLSYRRHKTGRPMEMKVTREMKAIICLFEQETCNSPYIFPIIRQPGWSERRQYQSALRQQNKYLKQFSFICYGMENNSKVSTLNLDSGRSSVRLSSHVARHSWASIGKEENLPLTVISEGLGHSSLKTTAIYLASFDRLVLDRANAKIHRAVGSVVA